MSYAFPTVLYKSFIGFDNFFDEISRLNNNTSSNYPPFDVIRKDNLNYQINLAVAGFKEDEIEIITFDNSLLIKGKKIKKFSPDTIHKGISFKPFEKKFNLNPLIEVLNAQLENGILVINLFRKKPFIKTPKKIEINVT